MAVLVTGEHLNRYVKPELLKSIQNTKDTFTGFFGKVNKSAATADGISVQKLINDITVKTGLSPSGVLTPRKLEGKKGIIPWMNFTTQTLYFDAGELRALAFDKKGEGRKMLKEAVMNALLKHTLHSISPATDAAKTVVVETTGGNDGSGRKKLIPKDILSVLRKTDIENPVLVLNKNHLIDLQENADTANRFSTVIINERTMTPVPYAGVNMVATDLKVGYTTAGNKKALTATPATTDKYASVFIDKSNTIYYLNDLSFHFTDMVNDTRNEIPRTEMRIYGTFIGAVIEDDRKQAAIIDGRTA